MDAPDGIPGSVLTGPYPVGTYAAALRDRLRAFTRVQVFGEVFGFKAGRAKVWFELRDAAGALPCSMWREDFEKLRVGPLVDGTQVVVAGGCDYYPGSRTASPGFSFAVARLRVAGEGDLLAQLEQLRRRLHGEGLFEPQKALPRPVLPRCIGVVTGESGKARDDVLAGLHRRGWAGRLVWGFAPVQDRHAAPAITRALQDLAAVPEIEVIVVARGGGSLADLFAFCDETLCRTVALLRVPVISSVGHHTDRTLLDDVAAIACSTPTHAAEAAVPVDCTAARTALAGAARRLHRQGRRALVERARTLARLSRAPGHHVARHRTRLHQLLRELRAATRRAVVGGERETRTRGRALERKAAAAALAGERASARARTDAAALDRAAAATLERRRRELDRLLATLAAHDPQRTLERGYALLEDPAGEPVTSAAAARALPELTVRLHDGRVTLRPDPRGEAAGEPREAGLGEGAAGGGRDAALEAPRLFGGP
ncbi:MAG TPA: exodeoxyribonuclease VII large subunit [Solirubrobacter sp.]|nr:exodeoxyribonuclease VII large subunit [Solirubrobacter sp.]